MPYDSILLASHGTAGARAAETLALTLGTPGAVLHHLLVVPELWAGMMGDDWLNNARTRTRFGNYLEQELAREVEGHLGRLAQAAADAGLDYRPEVRRGDPAACLLARAGEVGCRVVVVGAPRPKRVEGLRCRLELDPLARGLGIPLVIAPWPRG